MFSATYRQMHERWNVWATNRVDLFYSTRLAVIRTACREAHARPRRRSDRLPRLLPATNANCRSSFRRNEPLRNSVLAPRNNPPTRSHRTPDQRLIRGAVKCRAIRLSIFRDDFERHGKECCRAMCYEYSVRNPSDGQFRRGMKRLPKRSHCEALPQGRGSLVQDNG